jgi:hypothetical protein
MRYSHIESERTEEVDNSILEEDEITDKIPIEKFHQIHNSSESSDVALVRILLLHAKPDYIPYFGNNIYAIILKSEENSGDCWLGIPVKNPKLGIIRWEKERWDKIYGFSISFEIQDDF